MNLNPLSWFAAKDEAETYSLGDDAVLQAFYGALASVSSAGVKVTQDSALRSIAVLTRLVGADVTRRVLNEAAGVGDVDQVTSEWAAATVKELQEAIQRARNAGATEGTSA